MSEWAAAVRRVTGEPPPAPREPREQYRPFTYPHDLLPTLDQYFPEPAGWIPDQTVADMIGCTRRHIYRLKKIGLTYRQADRLATGLGRHGSEIWDNWWEITEQVTEATA